MKPLKPATSIHHYLTFVYVDKLVKVELPFGAGETRSVEILIACVQNWHSSPFVDINPNRTALIGRDTLLKLKPQVLLDFDKRQTEIVTAKKPAPTRKKTVSKKKNTRTILPKEPL